MHTHTMHTQCAYTMHTHTMHTHTMCTQIIASTFIFPRVKKDDFWQSCFLTSVARFGEILQKIKVLGNATLAKFLKTLGNVCYGLFSIWQTFLPTVANFYANFHCCKRPNIEK